MRKWRNKSRKGGTSDEKVNISISYFFRLEAGKIRVLARVAISRKGGYNSFMDIPKRRLGRTGEEVTILGLGGEGILRTTGYERDASMLINRAIDLGITYFESARAYEDSEVYYGHSLKRFALSQPVTTVIVGCDSVEQLEENVEIARNFQPMTRKESDELVASVSPYARQLMYYKP